MAEHNLMRRMAPFLVLEILKNHTDEDHGLKVTQIVGLMEKDYGIHANRKSVSAILNDLLELSEIPREYDWKNPMPFSIKFDVIPRSNGDIRENWRLCREFEDTEVRLLIDLVLSVEGYPHGRLLEKLQRLGSASMGRQPMAPAAKPTANHQMPVTISCIEKAIKHGQKLMFTYDSHGQDHTVSPYKTVFRNGNYYLICYEDGKEAMALYRVEKITEAVPLRQPAKDHHTVSALARWNFRLDAYLDHHGFLCNG